MNGWNINMALVDSILNSVPEPYVPHNKYTVLGPLILTSIDEVRAVIVEHGPYPNPSQANGLALSACQGCKTPPSLLNIKKENSHRFGA